MAVKFHPNIETALKEMGWERSPENSPFKGQWCTIMDGNIASIDDDPELQKKFMFEVVPQAESKIAGGQNRQV